MGETFSSLANKVAEPLQKPFPVPFISLVLYYMLELQKDYHAPPFFLSLLVSMFGISITPLLIFGETPGWLKDSKYTMTFSIIWIFLYILS
ncbi:MAG: hypothetical protein EZS28_038933, partial [Streblomastix strix]